MGANTKERIEENALLLFSRQGFHETSISEIAEQARVNEGTIFRLFSSKQDLYLDVLKKYARLDDIDLMEFQLSLTMEDVRCDLELLVQEYFRIYFRKIHVIRVFLAGLIQYPELREFGYLIIPALQEHFEGYLDEMEARRIIRVKDRALVVDLYMATILSDVARLTTFHKVEEYTPLVAEEVARLWEKRIEFFWKELVGG